MDGSGDPQPPHPEEWGGTGLKWIFKIPILYYRLGLGWMLEKRFLLLTTRGRITGKARQTPLEYVYNPEDGSYRISPGWGGNTDWYKNVLQDRRVTVQVGRRRFDALAEPGSDEEAARYMMEASRRHPRMDRIWNRWSDQPVDGSWQSYVHAAKYFPSIKLKPL